MSESMILEVVTGKDAGRRITVPASGAVLGRASECDISIDEPTLSHKDCRIVRDKTGWVIQDLGSRNGIIVNGQKMNSCPLKQGEEIKLGLLCLKVVGLSVPQVPPLNSSVAPAAHGTRGEPAKQEVPDSDHTRPQTTVSPAPSAPTNVKLHAITYVCVGITVLAVIVAVSAWRDAKELRNQLRQRDGLTASSHNSVANDSANSNSNLGGRTAESADGPELEGNDLLAWKLAYGAAIGGSGSEAFPSRPIRRFMTKKDNGIYVFLFSDFNGAAHNLDLNPTDFCPYIMWEVTVMDYGDKLQVVSSHKKYPAPNQTLDEYNKLCHELFGPYIKTAATSGSASVPMKTVPKAYHP